MEISKTHVFFSLIKFDLFILYDGLFLLMLVCLKHIVSLSDYTIWIANFWYFTTLKTTNLLVWSIYIKFSDFTLCSYFFTRESWLFNFFAVVKKNMQLIVAYMFWKFFFLVLCIRRFWITPNNTRTYPE